MSLFEGKSPAERNKIIIAAVIGLIALFLVGRMFFGSSGSSSSTNINRRQTAKTTGGAPGSAGNAPREEEIDTSLRPVKIQFEAYTGSEPGRNIFGFFARPVVSSTPTTTVETQPEATPAPPPPIILSSLAPQSVYAQTGEFRMQVSGDKFTPDARVYLNDQEIPTQFINAQQLAANVPAFHINAPGPRTIAVRTPDGQLFSNTATLNIMQPPLPTYTYIGYVQRRDGQEIVTLREGSKQKMYKLNEVIGKDLLNGDRFRVTNISPTKVELTDVELKIKHLLNYVNESRPGNPGQRNAIPPPPPTDEGGDVEEP